MKSMMPQGGSVPTGDYRLCAGTEMLSFVTYPSSFKASLYTNAKHIKTFCHMNNKASEENSPPEGPVSAWPISMNGPDCFSCWH